MLPIQHGLSESGVSGWMGRLTSLRVGKVVAVHRDSNSVDVAFMDGILARNVPVLSGQLGSSWGFASVVGPSYDQDEPVRKTYPHPQGNVVHAPGNEAGNNRDSYVACLQLDGSRHGQTGLLALGYVPPQVCEMFFPGGDNEYTDMVLYRTSSDVQFTVQRDGKFSMQHPSGARVTMGQGQMTAVNLTGKDFDKKYQLRQNTAQSVGFYVIDTSGSWVTLDHQGNIKAFAPKNIEVEAGMAIKAIAGTSITAQAGTSITAQAGTSISAIAGTSVTVSAGTSITVMAGTQVTVVAGAGVTLLSGGPITLTSGSLIALNAPAVMVNGTFNEAAAGTIGRSR